MARFNLARVRAPQAEAQTVTPAAPAPEAAAAAAPPPEPKAPPQPKVKSEQSKQIDMRLKLHARLIDELDLAKLDKLSEHDLRREVTRLTADFARAERVALNNAELDELGSS